MDADTCQKTGIVGLEDLPNDEVFVKLKPDFHNLLQGKIRNFGIEKFERKIGSGRKVGHWLTEEHLIRFDVLLKILDHFDMNYKNNIEFIRGKDGRKIRNPKFPFNFTSCQGVRIVSGILGDGGIPTNKPNPYYTNSDKRLINGFIKDMRFVFGDLEFDTRKIKKNNTLTTVLGFSSLIQKIFLEIGLQKGKKIITNPPIPLFIFNLDDDKKYAFISQFIDDEGSVNKVARHVAITAGTLRSYSYPNILKDMQKLFLSLGIGSSLYKGKYRSSFTGENTIVWRMQINGQFQLKQLHDNLSLRISRKRNSLKSLMKSFKLKVFRRKEYLGIYVDVMRKIQNSNGYFTSLDVSKETGRVVGSCRNTLAKFKEKGIITCIKSRTSGYFHEYGRYVLK